MTDSFEETEGKGLVIRTNPNNVTVFIDGAERGSTPVVFANMAPGEYHIRLYKEGYRERVFSAVIFNNSRYIALIKMEETKGEALVSIHTGESASTPVFKPELFLRSSSGVSIPLSPDNKAALTLPSGYHTFRARAFGWEDASITVLVEEDTVIEAGIFMKSAAFKVENLTQSRRRFNPANPGNLGVNEYRFEVSSFGSAVFMIQNSEGLAVYSKKLENFNTRVQFVTWDGRDSDSIMIPQGFYTAIIGTEDPSSGENVSLKLETEINYSGSIFPQSLESGAAGLVFSPMPHTLPAGSFQIDSGLLFSSFRLPFKIGLRLSPYKKIELTTILNINPDLKEKTGWGVSGSVMYNFIDGSNIPILFSTGVSYAWADNNGEYLLGSGRGAGFFTPVSLEFSNFSVVFCPSAFWRGPENVIPELFLSAGLLYRGNWINAGISARYEFDFKENSNERLLAGAQIYFFPSPSNLIFSLHGGIIYAAGMDYYGGLGIGLIY